MRTSEALRSMYQKMYRTPVDEAVISNFEKKTFGVFAQAPKQGTDTLARLMFEVPAYVLNMHKSDPDEARRSLERAIAGAQAYEQVLAIDDAGPSVSDFEQILKKIDFYNVFKAAI